MKQEQAKALKLCKNCTLWQSIKKVEQCTAGRLQSLNYRNVKSDECVFTEIEIKERLKQI